MIEIRPFAIGAALALVSASAGALAEDKPVSKGEADLAEMLEGRVAGEPQRCIPAAPLSSMTIIDDTALVFRVGSTLYVNQPANADLLSWSDVPVFERYGSQLCRLDRVELRDRSTLMPGPVLFLSDFVPYAKADKADQQGDVP